MQALSLCCSIFLTLLSKFRKSLKAEIAVFFPMILLKPIEPQMGNPSGNGGAQQSGGSVTMSHTHQVSLQLEGNEPQVPVVATSKQ